MKKYFKYFKYYLLKVLDLIGVLDKINITVTKNIYGENIKIPILGKTGLYNLVDGEVWLYRLYVKLYTLKKGSLVDVGINIGQTLIKLKSIDRDLIYYGFEPNPSCIFYAHQLVKANNFNNVKIFPVGLADSKSLLTLFADNEIASGASILEKFRENYKVNFKYSIPVWDFDDIDINKNELSIVKIDVEGYELEVLKGMTKLMQLVKPMIICEILPIYSLEKENGKYRYNRQNELINLLIENKYKLFLIDEAKFKLLHISEIIIHGDMNRTNYVFCHESDTHKLENIIF